jgi:hypothetical protein
VAQNEDVRKPGTREEILEALAPWRARMRRTAWFPEVSEGDGAEKGSRFGGLPWLPEGTEHPTCQICGEPLRLLLQLDVDSLPEAARGALPKGSLVQAFYCEDEDCESEGGWEPFARSHRVRAVDASNPGRLAEPVGEPHPVKSIASWRAEDDAPHPEEFEALGLRSSYDFQARTLQLCCPELSLESAPVSLDALSVEQIAQPKEGDKLGGWPFWIQSSEYPSCQRCKQPMRVFFQIESEQNVPQMWGDVGMMYLSQCEADPEMMTLHWSCA